MRFGRRVWSAGKLLIIVGALATTFIITFAAAMRVALGTREVEVPSLVGRSVTDATAVLTDLGLRLRIDENRRPHDEVPPGDIVQQDLPPGMTTRPERTIRVWLSSGPVTTIVPPLAGQNERTAMNRLAQEGVSLATVSEFRSPDYPADTIVAQDPPAETRAAEVSVLLNRGEQATTYVMPDVIGMNGERAAEALRRMGFRVTIIGAQPYPGVPPGTVLWHRPPGGYQVGPADPISLEVSQ
jgi:eukaryotic-like serine/threonine-protein kinase